MEIACGVTKASTAPPTMAGASSMPSPDRPLSAMRGSLRISAIMRAFSSSFRLARKAGKSTWRSSPFSSPAFAAWINDRAASKGDAA